MVLQVFSVFDSKAAVYETPFYARTIDEAIRIFAAACADSKSLFFSFPTDFTLLNLGSYDKDVGSYTLHPLPLSIASAVDFVPSR